MMRIATAGAVLVLMITGCGSTASSEPTSTGSATSAAPATTSATAAAAATLSCAEADMAASNVMYGVHLTSLNVGTENDSSPDLTGMTNDMASLTAVAPACYPKAATALAVLATAVSSLASAYKSGSSPEAVAADKAALLATVAKAKAAWKAMGKDASLWDSQLRFVE